MKKLYRINQWLWPVLLLLALNGCAVISKNIPAWTEYENPQEKSEIQLEFHSTGIGRPILLIHGFGASSYSWRYLIEPLSRNHRVITIDLKGFGDSPKPRDDLYSAYDQARLVRNFILEQNLQDLTIIGHSFGGGVALVTSIYLSKSHPGLQKNLVVIDSVAYPQELPFFVELLATPMLGALAVKMTPDTMQIKSLLNKVYFNDELIPKEAIKHYAEILAQPNAEYAILTTAKQIIPPDLELFSQNYSRLTLPTLIIWAEEDEIVPLKIGRRLHAELPNSEMIELSGVGHAPQEEKPELVTPLLLRFLQDDENER